MTPRETWNICKGYRDRANRDIQTSWEQIRWLGAIVLNPHTKKQIKPRDLMVFPWEQDGGGESVEEGIKRLKEMRNGIDNSRHNRPTKTQ
jgi:hypothetical protein